MCHLPKILAYWPTGDVIKAELFLMVAMIYDLFMIYSFRRKFLSASFHSFVASSAKDLGTLKKLEVRHDAILLITLWKLDWAVLKPAWGGNSY